MCPSADGCLLFRPPPFWHWSQRKKVQVIADEDPYSQSQGQSSHAQMWELDHNEGWTPNNWCFQTVVLEKTLESPLNCKEIKLVNPKRNQLWIFIERTDAEAPTLWCWCKEPTHWTHLKRLRCWERLKAGGEGDDRGCDCWMASPTQWTWVWVGSGSWWWTGSPGVPWSMESQTAGHDWATELNWTRLQYWLQALADNPRSVPTSATDQHKPFLKRTIALWCSPSMSGYLCCNSSIRVCQKLSRASW